MKNILVVFGGRSCEHDVSIITGVQAYYALDKSKYSVIPIYMKGGTFYTGKAKRVEEYALFEKRKFSEVTFEKGFAVIRRGLLWHKIKIACALLCNHGGEGENGELQGFFEVNGIPYTSASCLSSVLCSDKILTKKILSEAGFSLLPYCEACDEENIQNIVAKVTERLEYPVIVKPASLGSSIGISKVVGEEGLRDALELAFCYDNKAVIEQALSDFTEINCGAVKIGGKIILGELEKPYSGDGFLSFSDKYFSGQKGMASHEIPAVISDFYAEEIRRLSEKAYILFGLKGVVRADFLISGEGEIFLNEINTIPGSMAFYLFSAVGLPFPKLLEGIIEESISEAEKSKNKLKSFKTDILTDFSHNNSIKSVK